MKMEQFILDMISEIGGVEKTIAIGPSLLHLICNFLTWLFSFFLDDIKGDLLGSSCSIKLNFPSSKAQIVAGKYLKTEEENDSV